MGTVIYRTAKGESVMSKEFSGLLLRVRLEITPTDDVRVPGALQHDALLRHVAVQTRDRQKGGVCYGPGSAAHHERARRRAQTAHAALRPGHTTDSLILGQALRDQGLRSQASARNCF